MSIGLVRGAAMVASQEFRIRLRTGRWRWLLAAWVVVVGLFTGLLTLALSLRSDPYSDDYESGPVVFGALMLFVLALVLLVSPAITAQSINGDRERGTLATLQVTRLSAASIAVGKLVAGWAVGLTALALTLPFVGWSLLLGGVGVVRAVAVLAVVALLIGVVCAVSQALSALLTRSITSALLSYVTVFALTVGTLVAFSLGTALAADSDPEVGHYNRPRPDRVWWLLAPNPFVVLADAAPTLPPRRNRYTGEIEPQPLDPLGEIGRATREMRVPPPDPEEFTGEYHQERYEQAEEYPVWPYGLGFDLALGAGALAVTIARLRTPARKLARGSRIA